MILKDTRLQQAQLPDIKMKNILITIEKAFVMIAINSRSIDVINKRNFPTTTSVSESNLKEIVPDKTAVSVKQPIGRSDAVGGNPGQIHRVRRFRVT